MELIGAERQELRRLKGEDRRRRQERGVKRLTRPHWGHGSLVALAKAAAWTARDRYVFEFVRANPRDPCGFVPHLWRTPRIGAELAAAGAAVGRKRVAGPMRGVGLAYLTAG